MVSMRDAYRLCLLITIFRITSPRYSARLATMYSDGGDTRFSRHFSWDCINHWSKCSCMYPATLAVVAMAVSKMSIEGLEIFSFARITLASLGLSCCCLGHWAVSPLLSICLHFAGIHFLDEFPYPLTEPQIMHRWVSDASCHVVLHIRDFRPGATLHPRRLCFASFP
ncbi:uncharacterized protein EURHEDRAFT_205551 [Aspergillus ruber CBS 135680]|uniref:Uncharacterized protein n=1 Tax=Aspergillus ruber (strain CBS 135680) TaxID=1388766 RepID=A0A017S556_ASPRC|nr:uncharacterized protein EURHEDRAFT_205551 [Aspergillus ruber CBS 135680]EYE92153.1 hypothetical protein EURHEDRAFT_205551 [Aspergillus ruber CBS 135680]